MSIFTRVFSHTSVTRLFVVILLLSLLGMLVSCPTPVDDKLLIEVQDKFAPSVLATSPLNDSYYYSTITINGTISDSALTASDGAGELSSISYTVANDVSRRGRIIFSSNQSYLKDTDFGSGDIIYDKATGEFNITFSSIEVDGVSNFLNQRVIITITAIDKNNNTTTKTIRLLESDGPYINLVEPGTSLYYFSAGSHIIISGSIGNSFIDPNTADEIESLSWRVSNQAWNGSLDLSEDSSDFNGTIYTTANVALQYSDPFTYNPVTREFQTSFDLPFGDFSVIPIEVRATDKNNHTSYASFDMYTNEAGPVMTFTLPSTTTGIYNDGSSFYVNAQTKPDINLAWTLDSDGPLSTLGYLLPPNLSSFDNSLTLTTPAVIPGASISAGKIRLTVRAVNNSSKESRYYFDILADDLPPAISINNYYANTPGNYYAKPGDTVHLGFSVVDAGPSEAVSGLPSGLNPDVSIKGSTSLTPSAGYTYSYILPTDGTVITEDLALSITGVMDNVGNLSSANQSNAPQLIRYYSGSVSLTGINIVSSNSSSNTWAKEGDTITLDFTSPRDLLNTPTVTIAGNTPATLTNTGNNYTATYVMNGTDSESAIPYTIDFTDAAGNSGNSVSQSSTIVYDRTNPTLVSIVMNDYSLAKGQTTAVTFTFSEAVNGFSLGDIASGNGTVSGLSTSDNITYTATFTPLDNNESTGNVISVADNSYTDISGNNGTGASSSNYTIDTKLPVTTAVPSGGSYPGAQTVTLAADETATIYYTTDGSDPTTGSSSISTSGTVSVPSSLTLKFFAVDSAGNTEGISSEVYTIDTIAPTLDSIVMDDYSLVKGQTTPVTFTFSEAVNGFSLDDITSDNGTVSGLSTSDNTAYAATFTPADNNESTGNVISVADNSYMDIAGNNGTGAFSSNYTIDTKVPTLNSIVMNDYSLVKGQTTAVTFTFSEAVNGFILSDITSGNGTVSDFSTSNYITYTATFTPADNNESTGNVISVADNSYTDIAGNNGTGASSLNYAIDTIAPTLSSIVFANGTGTGGTADAGDTITITYTEALNPASIDASLTAGGSISGSFSALIGKLGAFSTSGDITADTSNLSLNSNGDTVVVTLGGSITGSTEPDGTFTSIGSITDVAGNVIDTSVSKNKSGSW